MFVYGVQSFWLHPIFLSRFGKVTHLFTFPFKLKIMCLNRSKVFNKYDKKWYYVDCGKCESCLQQKADSRASRILHACPDGYINLFFHLTYSDEFVPFFYIEDLSLVDNRLRSWHSIDIFRKFERHSYYNRKYKKLMTITNPCFEPLDTYFYDYCDEDCINKFHTLYQRNFCDSLSRVGCLYYPDIQKFFKRLRQNLNRNCDKYKNIYKQKDRILYFVCGEYGETNQRPHWHIILSVKRFDIGYLYQWREAISDSWLYADRSITYNNVDYAIKSAYYVSTYVNSSVDVSPFFQKNSDFKPIWHYSQKYGIESDCFSLPNLIDSVKKRDLRYSEMHISKDGKCRTFTAIIPTYVRNRLFPKFKGFSNLSYSEIRQLVTVPFDITKTEYRRKLDYSSDDCARFIQLVHRSALKYKYSRRYGKIIDFKKGKNLGKFQCELEQYADLYIDYLQAVNTTMFRLQYTDFKDDYDYVQRYDNLYDLKFENRPLLRRFIDSFSFNIEKYIVSTNLFKDNLNRSLSKQERFYKKVKQRKVNQLQLCQNQMY